MNFGRLASRLSKKEDCKNQEPLYSRKSLCSVFNLHDEDKKERNILQFLNKPQLSVMTKTSDTSCDFIESTPVVFKSRKKSVSHRKPATSSSIDLKHMLQLILQNTVAQLAIIVGKPHLPKTKLYEYKPPDVRFTEKKAYTLEKNVPIKTDEEKLLKIQRMIKDKIDELIIFLFSILRDTKEELRSERTYETLIKALDNTYKVKSDDFDVLNMKAEELCYQLFHDIKRIDKEADRLLEANREIAYNFVTAKDRITFINLKKTDYAQKYERSRRWLNKYISDKECSEISIYIKDVADKILKDEEVTTQITSYLAFDITELEHERDQYPEKLDNEVDMRQRVITQLKDDVEKMGIHRKELEIEVALREKQMIDWKIYRAKKEIEEAERLRIEEEEELARQEEAERIRAEKAAEEEYLETLTVRERIKHFDDKKKEKKLAAKAAKAAAKAEAKAAAKAAVQAEKAAAKAAAKEENMRRRA